MKVNIYYGGRGMVDDPTIFVMGKIQEVLEELNVNVTRYNLYEMKNTITTLSQTVTEADAVVLATTVEWLGMGGYMQSFLDSCWLYGDKDQIGKVYMFPVVMAKTYGEREVSLALANSWEIIGGRVAPALNAYVDYTTEFEFNMWGLSKIMRKQSTEQFHRKEKDCRQAARQLKIMLLKIRLILHHRKVNSCQSMHQTMNLYRHRKKILNHLQAYTKNC